METSPGNELQLQPLIQELEDLELEMLALETLGVPDTASVHPSHKTSASNLLHYLVLRRHDIRELQEQLAAMGLSSLGRTESHVLSALGAVKKVLCRLSRTDEAPLPASGGVEIAEGRRLLENNTDALLGPAPEGRNVRIMVTMSSDAATDYDLVRDLVQSGMNCMRINCAHDGEEAWSGMIRNLRRAEQETGKSCKVAMDVAGPKLRTGPVELGPTVAKSKPTRDPYGRNITPARIWLTPGNRPEKPPSSSSVCLRMAARWLSQLKAGDRIRFSDARGARRAMVVSEVVGKNRWAECARTSYFVPGLALTAESTGASKKARHARIGPLPEKPQTLLLRRGETLVLTRSLESGRPARADKNGRITSPATIGVTLGEFFDCVKPGEPIWLDDGKIGGVILSSDPDRVTVEITQAKPEGEKLGAEKGINVPDTQLRVPSLTKEDLKALEFIAKHADIVGYSFVRSEADVWDLQAQLERLGAADLGIILKIETQQGFESLPRLLLAAMKGRAAGVMIARGDLAIECGYRRLAEVQEEILWISEAARVPVIWATQVLESLAKNGVPSRSEITDAAMGERAECVMLNKGPYVVTAVQALDDILHRMGAHQEKKSSRLRKLHVATAFASSERATSIA